VRGERFEHDQAVAEEPRAGLALCERDAWRAIEDRGAEVRAARRCDHLLVQAALELELPEAEGGVGAFCERDVHLVDLLVRFHGLDVRNDLLLCHKLALDHVQDVDTDVRELAELSGSFSLRQLTRLYLLLTLFLLLFKYRPHLVRHLQLRIDLNAQRAGGH
jgi:hypothetical protein